MDEATLDQLSKFLISDIELKDRAKLHIKSFEDMPIEALKYLTKYWLDNIKVTTYSKEAQIGLGLAAATGIQLIQRREQS